MIVKETNGHELWLNIQTVVWADKTAQTVRLTQDSILTLEPESFNRLWAVLTRGPAAKLVRR